MSHSAADALETELAERAARRPSRRHMPLLLYGMLSFCFGSLMYLFGVVLVFPRYLLGLNAWLDPVSEWIVWYSGIPIVAGTALALVDLLFFLDRKRPDQPVRYRPLRDQSVTVALTAYDDEASIAEAIHDFRAHPAVDKVIVVSNNSRDRTLERAADAGATAVNEPKRPAMAAASITASSRRSLAVTRSSSCCARATLRSALTISTSSWPTLRTPIWSTAPAPWSALRA